MSPYPPAHGQPMNVTLGGTSKELVQTGSLTATVLYWGMQVFQQTGDLCSGNHTVPPCPLAPGPVSITNNGELPSIAPPGPYTMRLEARAPAGGGRAAAAQGGGHAGAALGGGRAKGESEQSVLMCVEVSFHVGGWQQQQAAVVAENPWLTEDVGALV